MHTLNSVWLCLVFLNFALASGELLSKTVDRLSGTIADISVPPMQPPNKHFHCMKLQCKLICVNGKGNNLYEEVLALHDTSCQYIDELHLFNYEFSRKVIPKHFLGNISDTVKHLSIYASDVIHIENGAFESSSLNGLHLEGLKLIDAHKGIFEKISDKFTHFTLIQKGCPIESVDDDFLKYVKYQIKAINIQTGLLTVKNLSNSNCLLNNLEDVNLSFNNFDKSLTPSSFAKLSVVEKLNLSHSEIVYLPEFIFSDIIGTLRLLDLSYNKLTVISQNVFGWHELGKSVIIYLADNPWKCSCDLRTEMVKILTNQNELVYCEQPKDILVTDERLCSVSCSTSDINQCHGGSNENLIPDVPSPSTVFTNNAEEAETTPFQTTPELEEGLTTDSNGFTRLTCYQNNPSSNESQEFTILWPNAHFDIREIEGFKVEVEVTEVSVLLNGTYGILWFSNVTTQYYKMEINYNEFGLGCFGIRQYVTTVENLLPDMAYTFCLVFKDELTVSPFSCKSVYIGGNLNIKYNAWLTTNMRATGITLVIIGIVLCNFLGIISVFLILKRKPTLVKGSKRVATQKNDSMNIIVFPKDKTLQKFKMMEEQIAKRNSKGLDFRRLSSVSVSSLDSNQSYMNPVSSNLYEIIPAYQRYLSTYANGIEADVSYADIPFKRKRTSNDPLPAIPSPLNELSSPVLKLRNQETYGEYGFIPEDYNV